MIDVEPFGIFLPIFFIFFGCCSNVISLEFIVQEDSATGNLITFFHFLIVALEGLFTNITLKYSKTTSPSNNPLNKILSIRGVSLLPRHIPIQYHLVIVLLFFSTSAINNMALGYHISLPFHMIFRSGSLIANVIMGRVIFGKKYSLSQIISVILVTVGIFIATFATASSQFEPHKKEENVKFLEFLIGIGMLTTALLLSALLGLFQEYTYRLFGKGHHRESMFYSHLLGVPCFAIFYKDILHHARIFHSSPPFTEGILGNLLSTLPFSVPRLWVLLTLNVATQYICIRAVFTLTSMASSLTGVLVLSVRKFVSLLISVIYFKNAFTLWHWIGTALVFTGSMMYKEKPQDSNKTINNSSKKSENNHSDDDHHHHHHTQKQNTPTKKQNGTKDHSKQSSQPHRTHAQKQKQK